MGWTFGWHTKAELVDYIKSNYAPTKPDAYSKILRASLVGSHLWMAMEYQRDLGDTDGFRKGDRWIALYLLKGDRVAGYNGPQWGYKDMDESCGPNEVDCPLGILDLVPDPGWKYPEYNRPWRDRVREYHAAKKRAFTPGQHVYLPAGYRPNHFIVVNNKPLQGREYNATAHDMAPYGPMYLLPRTKLLTEAPA